MTVAADRCVAASRRSRHLAFRPPPIHLPYCDEHRLSPRCPVSANPARTTTSHADAVKAALPNLTLGASLLMKQRTFAQEHKSYSINNYRGQ
jgi:hypothetical protein